jgi:hypothetical protein
MGDYWKPTSDMFSGLIEKPKMTEKLLSKPPFKYIFDIIIETSKKTNFARGTLSVTSQVSTTHNNSTAIITKTETLKLPSLPKSSSSPK